MAETQKRIQHAFGPVGKTAGWDGHAWDGVVVDAPRTEAIPEPKHGFLPFLRHKWFWLVVAGQLLVLLASYVAASQDSRTLAWLTLPGYILFMTGAVLIFDRHVRWGDLLEFGKVLGAGLVIVMFRLARHTARELAPPDALPQNSSRWRPQQKAWGVATR